jgi:hypothetical protein
MRRPSFPTVISLIALFVALGGTSYAVIKLPAKSVGNRELKSNAVTSSKIRPGAVSRSDLSSSARSGTRGPRGPAGPAGPAGAAAAEAWKPLQLIGGWARYSGGWPVAAYRKNAAGRVYLRGVIKRAGGPAGGPIAVLPAGYRPADMALFGPMMGNNATNAAGRVDITTTGEIVWMTGPMGDPNYTSLDGISFWTD